MKFSDLPPLPFDIRDAVCDKAKQLKLAIFDVDGVLTDGRLYYGKNGEKLKVFHALDGHGLKMLQQAGIQVAIITARKSQALATRLQDLNIAHVYMGAQDKVAVFEELIHKLGLKEAECAFTGDDVIDLGVMQRCGLTFSVDNGHFVVKHVADWVSPLRGGLGAVRSVCDILLYCNAVYPVDSTSTQQ
jgi:3-deoxy-D-manno-octulosonate 8-phosphate phosphatase (KDO 8-P phosphatase)